MPLALIILVIVSLFHTAEVSAALGYVPGEVLVQYKTTAKQKAKIGLLQRHRAKLKQRFQHLPIEQWQLPSDLSVVSAIQSLKDDPNVAVVEPNYRRYPASISRALPIEGPGQYDNQKLPLEQVAIPSLWDKVTGDPSVIVAVIDDAFDINHPDLQQNIYKPYDLADDDNDPSPVDNCLDPDLNQTIEEDHGTTVLGIIGAGTNNGIGIAGAAWNVSVMPLRISCLYDVASEVAAFEYAVKNGASIINTSYGGPMYSVVEQNAMQQLKDQDVLLVAAAGNFDTNNDKIQDYPSGLDLPNIIAVAASDGQGELTPWSHYGATSVDVAAPGLNYYTTMVGDRYGTVSGGTSYSAPIVASIAALLKSSNPSLLNFQDLRGAILGGVTPLTNSQGRLVSDGQVDALKAYDIISQTDQQPVIVIRKIVIDDSRGNNNGQIDKDEEITVKLTIENVGTIANDVVFNLSSDVLDQAVHYQGPAIMYSGDTTEASFDIGSISLESSSYQEILFALDIETNVNGSLAQTTRHFYLDWGGLDSGKSVIGKLKKTGSSFDEIHFYHIDVPANTAKLKIEVEIQDTISFPEVDLMARMGGYPQFDFNDYDKSWGISQDTYLANKAGNDVLEINRPQAGTWYIAVLSPRAQKYPDVQYSLKAKYTTTVSPSGGFHLAFGIPEIFFLWTIAILLRIATSRGQESNTKKP